MKTFALRPSGKNIHSTLSTIIQSVFTILLLLIMQSNFIKAQLTQPIGAQSTTFGKPFEEAAFTTPTIFGATIVCTGQTTSLTVNSGYSSYLWSNGNTSSSNTVGVGSYTVTVTDVIGCTRSNSVVVTSHPCGLTLNLKCFIEGYYVGVGAMTPALMNQGIGSNPLVTDTIEIELRNQNAPYNLVATSRTILNTNGTATATFTTASADSYYIAIKHRNGLYTWSKTPIVFSVLPISYDFTTAANKAYGDNMIEVETGKWAFFVGDLNTDDNVDLLDLAILETDILSFQFGYFSTDINGDGNVDLLDSPIVESNIINFIFSSHP